MLFNGISGMAPFSFLLLEVYRFLMCFVMFRLNIARFHEPLIKSGRLFHFSGNFSTEEIASLF